ncbi:MAG TPA: hypothetical protein VFU31_01925, partial [Candidatus Binatia bacterium]|nr:hypothetical protein [Candidatus Binatia bacterium]
FLRAVLIVSTASRIILFRIVQYWTAIPGDPAQPENQKTLWVNRLPGRRKGNMAFYAVDLRHRVIQRVTHQHNGMDNKRFFLIKAGSAKKAWAKANRASGAIGNADCGGCSHRHCSACEECSVAKRYSDYWICHCCGELNRRVQNFHLREVSHGLGKN